jgi:hypothetical protein
MSFINNLIFILFGYINQIIQYIKKINLYLYILIGILYSKLISNSLIYLPDKCFIIFKCFNLIDHYYIKENSYEYKNLKNVKYIYNKSYNVLINTRFTNKLNKFNIIHSCIILINNNKIIKKNISNKLHFIYLINNNLNISDLSLILKNNMNNKKYDNIYIDIIFSLNNKIYIKNIDYNEKKYIDNTDITFGKIFYDNKKDDNIFSDESDDE